MANYPKRIKGWEVIGKPLTAQHLKPLNDTFKKIEPRSLFLEPSGADSQCTNSGAGEKPGGEVNETCYICGFKIDEPGNLGTDSITACRSGLLKPTDPLETWTETDGTDTKAWYEKKYGKNKKLVSFHGFSKNNPVIDKTDDFKKCGTGGKPVWGDIKCNMNNGGLCKTQKIHRLFRKNKLATPCGSQCEHILPIVTLAFLLGLKLSNFDDRIKEIFSPQQKCNYPNIHKYKDKFKKWRNKLLGLKEDGSQPDDPSDPDENPGVVYLWAHPYCNQLKDAYPFLNVDFNLEKGIETSVNENNIQYILQTLGGYYLSDDKKNLILRSNWWDGNCVDNDEHIKKGDGDILPVESWYNKRVKALTEQINNLKTNINLADKKTLAIYSSICIQAVKNNILNIAKTRFSGTDQCKKLEFINDMDRLFRTSQKVLQQTGGAGKRKQSDVTLSRTSTRVNPISTKRYKLTRRQTSIGDEINMGTDVKDATAVEYATDVEDEGYATEIDDESDNEEPQIIFEEVCITDIRNNNIRREYQEILDDKKKLEKFILDMYNILKKKNTGMDNFDDIIRDDKLKERFKQSILIRCLFDPEDDTATAMPLDEKPTEGGTPWKICDGCERSFKSLKSYDEYALCELCHKEHPLINYDSEINDKEFEDRQDKWQENIQTSTCLNNIEQLGENIIESISYDLDLLNQAVGSSGSLKYKKKKTKRKKKRKPKKKRKSKKKKSKRKKRTKQKKKDKKKKTKRRSRKKK